MKIIDRIRNRQEEGQPFFSFEYFSPKTSQGMVNLHDRIERMCHLGPEFVDITWGAGGSRPAATMEVVSHVQKVYGVETCMHLICTNNPTFKIDQVLKEARACGNQNILALRGDPIQGQQDWTPCEGGLCYASDLIHHIRKTHGDYFGIGVAGYPESHPESSCPDQDLVYLKRKVDAGADFIVTQLFFDVPLFLNWVRRCRAVGIQCPILPGLMPIQSYGGFIKNTAGLSVPSWIREGIEAVKHDDQAVRAFGVKVGIQMTKELIAGGAPGIHFYTFNLEKSTRLILEGSGLVPTTISAAPGPHSQPNVQSQFSSLAASAGPNGSNLGPNRKSRPWHCSFNPKRRAESIRPIFWNNRPKSYISRTESWSRFPAETSSSVKVVEETKVLRGGPCWSLRPRSDSGSDQSQFSSPFFKAPSPLITSALLPTYTTTTTEVTYGSLDGCGVGLKYSTVEESNLHWGAAKTLQDLQDIFARYCRGEILTLPWCDQPLSLPPLAGSPSFSPSSRCLRERLVQLTSLGYLPLNAQSTLSGGDCKSEDKVFGWGPRGGQIHQKAYAEFFVSPSQFEELESRIRLGATSVVSFGAMNRARDLRTNMTKTESKVINWGVFPVDSVDPADPSLSTSRTRTEAATIVDLSSFEAWAEEAFSLWDQWSRCFEEGSESHELLKGIGQDWYLMFVVQDDDHQGGHEEGLFDLLEKDLKECRLRQQDGVFRRSCHNFPLTEKIVVEKNHRVNVVQEAASCSA